MLPAIKYIKKITQKDIELRVLANADENRLHTLVDSTASAIAWVIPCWKDTPEGVEFWYQIWRMYAHVHLTEQFGEPLPVIIYKSDPERTRIENTVVGAVEKMRTPVHAGRYA